MDDVTNRIRGNVKTISKSLHCIVWILIYMVPVILTVSILDIEGEALKDIMLGYTSSYIIYLIAFYSNWVTLFDKFLVRKKIFAYILINLVIAVVLATMKHYATVYLTIPGGSDFDKFRNILMAAPIRLGIILGNITSIVFVDLICIAIKSLIKMYSDDKQRQQLELQREREKTEAELSNLKDKLNPHFLFNALNNIYALAAIDSDKTQGAIDSLSKLLRYVLYQNDDLVPVSGEISFTKSYIDLMALRLDPSRTTLTVNVENVEDDTLKVAPLMLMTLIENAFKHGVSVHSKSFIDIDIRTVDSGNGKTMRCKVANSLFPKDSTDKSGSGIGTVNLQKRLDIIYPGKYTYDVTIEDGRYSVVLEIPLQTL